MWAVLARRVCADGKQYTNTQELHQVIVQCWATIGEDIMCSFIDSKKCGPIEVVSKDDNAIDV
jgi:hypothetical protein